MGFVLKCKICGSVSHLSHEAIVLNKYSVKYFYCPLCEFLQTEEPYWLDESYSNAISISDTGVMSRNNYFADIAAIILLLCGKLNGKFLDFGGGYGIFTRLMRDKGFDFYWHDKYAENLLARGFEHNVDDTLKYTAITSFENFEHFNDPLTEIASIVELSDFILFSTKLLPKNKVPLPGQWWYYCLEHGQHISLFSYKTFEFIADKYGYFFISNGSNLHILSKKKMYKGIFIIASFFKFFGMNLFFKIRSKTLSDMHMMISKMEIK